ncbi:unnamed protein product [Amoebophrya sp. A25]|nr:unnamed protein product [Amoebophrya sp. A25]|eukprot:GSA25T00018494001.1
MTFFRSSATSSAGDITKYSMSQHADQPLRRLFQSCILVLSFCSLAIYGEDASGATEHYPVVEHEWRRPSKIDRTTTLYASTTGTPSSATSSKIKISATQPSAGYIATATYAPVAQSTGWSHLNVKTSECDTNANDFIKAYAAGYMEGYLMMTEMQNFLWNTELESGVQDNPSKTEAVLNVMTAQDRFVGNHDCESQDKAADTSLASKNKAQPAYTQCAYGHQAFLIHMQLHGMLQGHNQAVREVPSYDAELPGESQVKARQMGMDDLLRLNADGAIGDYLKALYDPKRGSRTSSSASSSSFTEKEKQESGSGVVQMNEKPTTSSSGSGPNFHSTAALQEKAVQKKAVQEHEQKLNNDEPASSPSDETFIEKEGQLVDQSENTGTNSGTFYYPRGDDRPGRCSALVKLIRDPKTGAVNDIMMGHSSWESFEEMNRVWKAYEFPFCGVAAKVISFSSYPGAISSTDDFMLTRETELAIAETSLNANSREWGTHKYVEKEKRHVPDYVHIMVVTRLAADGLSWMQHFSDSQNSLLTGAYNSQWMVVDYGKLRKRVSPNNLPPFTLTVLETAPGASQWRDMTARLEQTGFWASFNEPYFAAIQEHLEGGGEAVPDSSIAPRSEADAVAKYVEYPRFRVFEEKQQGVKEITGMKDIMRTASEYETIKGKRTHIGYGHAICSRPDLGAMGHLSGCCDSKVVTAKMVDTMSVLAINGPSTVGNDQVFDFSRFPSARHRGLPARIEWGWHFATLDALTVPQSDTDELPSGVEATRLKESEEQRLSLKGQESRVLQGDEKAPELEVGAGKTLRVDDDTTCLLSCLSTFLGVRRGRLYLIVYQLGFCAFLTGRYTKANKTSLLLAKSRAQRYHDMTCPCRAW